MAVDRAVLRFDDYELDVPALELRRDGQLVAVEPQVFDVLCYLVAERDRVVPKTELLDNVWGDRFVSESALTSRIKSLRQAVGDDGRAQRVIRTAHGRGYQFVGRVHDAPSGGQTESATRPAVASDHEAGAGGLISRERELAAILDEFETSRLITLIGPGGVGKTRLATEVSRVWEDSGERSVFVQLEAITEPEFLLPKICDTLGLRAETEVDLLAVLGETLRDESMLLVLDNFEQLIAASGEIADLVAALPRLRVLVTSRDRLRLSVEQIVVLEPLETGTGQSTDPPASILFEQLARQGDPKFRLTDENRPTVSAICRLVDGLPLAIGLAAAQLRYLSIDYLLSHLEVNAGSMAEGVHDRPERQHSVSRLIDWSYQLLTPSQQLLLTRLSVFAGGWSLAGAAAVGRFPSDVEALAGLASLVDKSLIRSRSDGGAPRFSMLNLIDGYATAQLEIGDHELDAKRDHGAWVAAMVRSIEEERWDRLAGAWIDELNVEHANIVAALRRAVDVGHPDLACRIIGDLNMWWYRTGRHLEGRRWIDWALANLGEVGPEVTGRVHLGAGFMAFSDGDMNRARGHYELTIEAATEAGDWRYEQQALANLSITSVRRSEESEPALLRLDGVIGEAEHRQEHAVLAHALNVSGVLLRFDGQPELARARYEAALVANRRTGDRYQEAMNLGNLAHLAGSIDEIDEALSFARSALHIAWRIGSQVMSAWTLGLIAGLLHRSDQPEDAAKLLGASGAVLDSLGAHRGTVADQSAPQETRSALGDLLGEARFDELTVEGRALTLEAAVELALRPAP